jgi:pyruvate-ferredoxin/flavodoxin oxidoreductase
MGSRINTVMQPCFFQLSGVLPPQDAIAKIKAAVENAYANRGRTLVERNFGAIDAALSRLGHVTVPASVTSDRGMALTVPEDAPDFVKRVTSRLMSGEGDLLPVSALPADGTFLSGTAKYEKRAIAKEIPIWDPDICIDCGKCAIVCPHATIRMKVFEPRAVDKAPGSFLSKEFRSKDIAGYRMAIQVAPDDCTGCGVCVDVCPAKSKVEARHKAINMEPVLEHRDGERANWDFFLSIPSLDRDLLPHDSAKGSQALEPLFEFSGACAGCGETPYLKLATHCSVTACSSPTPRGAPRSTARTCPPPRGR